MEETMDIEDLVVVANTLDQFNVLIKQIEDKGVESFSPLLPQLKEALRTIEIHIDDYEVFREGEH